MSYNQPPGRLLGYARVSTEGQDFAYQLERLRAAGCTRIFREKRSGKDTTNRPQLRRLLRTLEPGDMVLATVTDRMARDPLDMLTILNSVKASGAGLRLLDEPFIDTTSEMADLLFYFLGWIARWHRLRILENTAHGREMARRRGVKFGRPSKLTPSQREEAFARRRSGEPVADLAQAFGVSASTIKRVLRPGLAG